MQKVFQEKRTILVLAIFALFALMLLTNAIGKMDFQPSQPIGGGQVDEGTTVQILDVGQLLQTAAEVPFWKQLVFWAVLFLFLLFITSLLNPELRKQLIWAFIRVATFALVLFYLMKKEPELFAGFFGQFTALGQDLALNPQTDIVPAPVFNPPQEVSWLSFAVTLGLISLVVLVVWWANRVWVRFRELNDSREPLEEFAKIARSSLNELQSGRSYKNAIVECYDRMSDVIAKKQGLQRGHAMTPSEFATRLTRAGLPRDPVETLTRLFESVRYGKQPAGQMEINQAINSLKSILAYCGEAA